QSDLIQLSLTCSQFRNKLNSTIFRKIELLKDGEIIPGKPNKSSKKKQLDILIDILEEDYLDKYHFVKHCISWEFCNNSFNTQFFNMFKYITKLELYSGSTNITNFASDTGNSSRLINILKYLKNLEILRLGCKLINFTETENISDFKLPICLKVLNVMGFSSDRLSFSPIENINEEYAKLKNATIINNSMLASMVVLMSSLTEVTFFNNQYFSADLLCQFFSLNPQLKKISISLKFVQSNHLNIGCDITQNILIPILSTLTSLQTLEFSEYDFWNFSSIDWSSYDKKIPLFYLNGIWNANSNVDEFVNPEIFDKIKFSNMFELEYYFMYYGFDELDNWKVVQDDLADSREFWLVKKGEDEVNK
ncbi:hypothetical protein CONCODRAFT_11556, partial [Conidiobolus coronatus NRRL 28638]